MKARLIYPALLELARLNADSYLKGGVISDGAMAEVYFRAAYGACPIYLYEVLSTEDIYGEDHDC